MNPIKSMVLGAVGVLAVIIGLNSFTIVNVGEEAATSSFGVVHKGTITGFNLVAPWWSVDSYSLQHDTYTYDDVGVASLDKFKTQMDVAITGSFVAGYADEIRRNTGTDYKFLQTHVYKRVRSCLVKAGGTVINSQAFFSKGVQEKLSSDTLTCANDYLSGIGGYQISAVQFSDIALDPQVRAFMVKTKQRQEEENQAMANLQIAETNAQKIVKEAEAQDQAAEFAKMARMKAADAALYEVQMQAQGNKELTRSLTPALVDYIKAQSWDGKLPQYSMGGEAGLLLSVKAD